jgi:hypothetical protein
MTQQLEKRAEVERQVVDGAAGQSGTSETRRPDTPHVHAMRDAGLEPRARIVITLPARHRGHIPAARRKMEREIGRNLTCCRMVGMEVAIHEDDPSHVLDIVGSRLTP